MDVRAILVPHTAPTTIQQLELSQATNTYSKQNVLRRIQ